MELTLFANWLNTAFAGFDYSILEFYHGLAEKAAFIITPVMEFFSIIGDNGYFGFALAFVLMLFKKTRKSGVCVFLAIAFGALITNITLKELIARPRPFQSGVEEFHLWWQYVGASEVSEFSFPSGHVTAAMASMTALCLNLRKKLLWLIAPSALYVVIMMMARNYLMVHYPTDVIAGVISGTVGATAAFFAAMGIFKLLKKHENNKFIGFVLNWDVRDIFKKKNTKTEA